MVVTMKGGNKLERMLYFQHPQREGFPFSLAIHEEMIYAAQPQPSSGLVKRAFSGQFFTQAPHSMQLFGFTI